MEKDKEEEGVPESVNDCANAQRPERDGTLKELSVGWKLWSIVVCEMRLEQQQAKVRSWKVGHNIHYHIHTHCDI